MSTATGPNQIVTSVIQHQVKAGEEDRYEAWLREITPRPHSASQGTGGSISSDPRRALAPIRPSESDAVTSGNVMLKTL